MRFRIPLLFFFAAQQSRVSSMLEVVEGARERGFAERSFGGWRAVASAWLVVVIFVALFATAEALAARHRKPSHQSSVTGAVTPRLAGAVIPRHDPGFPGPDEVAASDWLQRVKAEAYSCW